MKIHTEPYCETCLYFEANSWLADVKTDANNDMYEAVYFIECKHRDACARMYNCLSSQIPPFIEKERGNGEKI